MNDQRKILGLNRNIFILGLTSFFNDFSNQMILAAFPAFFISVLKSGAASLGLVEGIADGAANFLRIYSGNLSDKISKRRVFIFFGYSLSVFVRPLYMIFASLYGVAGVLVLRVTDRMGKGVREAPRDVIISVSAKDGEAGRSFGYHKAMDTAGGILGPIAAFFILKYMPGQWGMFFIISFVIGIISVATIFFVKDVVVAKSPNGHSIFSFKTITRFPKSFRVYLVSVFIFSIGSLPTAVLLLKTSSVGLLVAAIPLYYMIYSVSFTAFSYSAGKLSDKIGTGKIIMIGYFILIISYIGIIWASTPLTLGIFFAIMGIFSACTDGNQRAHIAKNEVEYDRGTAYGLLNGSIGFGSMISGIIGGLIWQNFGAEYALILASVFVVIGLIIFEWSRVFRRREDPANA